MDEWTANELRDLAARRAGGSASEANYDPELLDALTSAAEQIERGGTPHERR